MRLDDLRNYLSVFSLILGSAGFWTVMVVGGIRQLIDLEGSWLWVVFGGIYLSLVLFDVIYNLPQLRNLLDGQMIEEKYYSLRIAWVHIIIVSVTAALILTNFLMDCDYFVGVSWWLMAGGLFVLFVGFFCYLSFFQRSFRSRR